MKVNYYKLNTQAVGDLIRAQALKRYWVAEVAGVHKTTLRRWMSGEILRVREDHLLKLAGVFATSPLEISENYPR